MVVVEGLHHAVKCLQIAEVSEGLCRGDKDDYAESDGIGPEELAYPALVFEEMGCREKERYHEPYPRQRVFH